MGVAGANVRTIRSQLGISLRALSKASGVDGATISRIETGKQNLTEGLAEKLAAALNVSRGMLFADPDVLELSMLHMRRVPLLTPAELTRWVGPDSFEELTEQVYLHTALEVGSRFMFAVRVVDRANEPVFQRGDLLIFDAKMPPAMGDMVAALDGELLILGRLRLAGTDDLGRPAYVIVPEVRLYPEAVSTAQPNLQIRGTLVERRQYFSR